MSDAIQGSADNQQISDPADKKQDKVSYDTYQRVLAEAKAAKEKVKNYESVLKEQEEAKLKAQNEWKTLAEAKEKEAIEYRSKFEELNHTLVDAVKLQAFQKHLGGKIKNEQYFQFVNTDEIAYNPETKRVDEESAKKAASEFLKAHSSLVEFKVAKLPNEASKASGIKKTVNELSSKELEEELRKFGKL